MVNINQAAKMTARSKTANWAGPFIVCFFLLITYASCLKFGDAELVYQWKYLDFDWPSEDDRLESIKNGSYIQERNLLAGIKIYKDDVYVTVPRWFWTSGHPVTLAKIVTVDGKPKLRPYPSWAAQKQGDCGALQFIQSMEIDPNTGLMYTIDTGRIGGVLDLCPAKIVVYDLNIDQEVDRYEIPAAVANRSKCFLNDIVLDYVDGQVRYAYISDPREQKLVIYNFRDRTSHFFQDPSMTVEKNNGSAMTLNGVFYNVSSDIDGIAISYDFKYVYYCALGAYNLYQIPTSALRRDSSPTSSDVRSVGNKLSQTDGMAQGDKHLFYTAIADSAIYYWDTEKDMSDQKVGIDKVKLATQVELYRNDTTMQWPDTFAFDHRGWLWVVANHLQDFRISPTGINPDEVPYMNVWKVYINETGYLYGADKRTANGN